MIIRILLLLSISWVIQLTDPLFSVFGEELSGRDLPEDPAYARVIVYTSEMERDRLVKDALADSRIPHYSTDNFSVLN